MNTSSNDTYRKWVGVVLGLLLYGSAHFLSGARATGIKWYLGITGCELLPLLILAIPGTAAYATAMVFKTQGITGLPPETHYIKRIAGLPGDKIRIEPPNLIVNGQVVSNPASFRNIASAQTPYAGGQRVTTPFSNSNGLPANPPTEVVLGKDQYFILGDNTHNSIDSRYFGPVPKKNIVGKAARIYWPPDRIKQPLESD